MLFRITFITMLTFVGTILFAQSLILEDYVMLAKEQNLQVRDLRLKTQKQSIRATQVKTLWNPNLDAQVNYLFALGGREIVFPLGDLFNPTHGALNQLLGREEFPTDLENSKFQLTPNNFLDASLSVSKPIINSIIKYNYLIQKTLIAVAEEDVSVAQHMLAKQVRIAYYNHLKTYTALEVVEENKELLEVLREYNQKLVKYDKATAEVVSDVDYQLSDLRSQAANIIEQRNVTRSIVNLLINQNLEDDLMIDSLLINRAVDQEKLLIQSLSDAINNRGEFRKIQKVKEILTINEKLVSSQGKPQLGIIGGIGIQAEEFSFETGGPLYTLGLGMKMNILDGGMRKKKMEELSVDYDILDNQKMLLTQSVSLDLLKAKERLVSLISRMTSDIAAYDSAKQSFDLVKVRYENQKALLIELLQAQNRMAVSEIKRIITKYDIYIQEAEINYIIGR